MPPPRKVEPSFTCQTYGVRDAAKILGISYQSCYRLISSGQLAHLRLGGRLRVHRATLTAVLGHPLPEGGGDVAA